MSLKVIGAGFGRTGTASLKIALEQLGLDPCYHMKEIIQNPHFTQYWMRAASGSPDWEQIFDGYQATMDFPAASFWRELSDYYPDAKVILTIRDAEDWFRSTQETVLNREFWECIKDTPLGEMNEVTILKSLEGNLHDRDHMIEVFNRHTEEVRNTIPPERLLLYEVSQGWEPLCKFMGVAAPDTPFPRANSREETAAMIAAAIAGRAQ